MSTIDERSEFLKNPYFTKHIYGDFTPFYITIAICTVLGFFLFALNIAFGCCSRYRQYWYDRHTGNRWLVSLWTSTAHNQPPLDLKELEDVVVYQPIDPNTEYVEEARSKRKEPRGYLQSQHQYHHQHARNGEEFVELQKRESDI